MDGYRVFIHADLLETIPAKGRQRERIMEFVRLLRQEPRTPGDYTYRDETQRELEVKIVGDFAVSYWVDEAVKAVMILGARHADQ